MTLRNGDRMIIALFALAVAMIVGGLLAAFLGWDIVLVERGWSMVIAGSVFAASGAVLLGIAAAVSRLARMQADLAHLNTRLGEASAAALQPAPDLSRAALAGGLLGGAAGAAAVVPPEPELPPLPLFPEAGASEPEEREAGPDDRDETAAGPVVPFEPKVYPEPEREPEATRAPEEETAPEVRLPDFLLVGRHRESIEAEGEESELDGMLQTPQPPSAPPLDLAPTPAETGPVYLTDEDRIAPGTSRPPEETGTEQALAAEPEPGREVAEPGEFPAAAPQAEDTATEETAAEEPAVPEAQAEEPATATTIIGTYTSGDNRYVMYSDGSIEAETPQGLFHFNSLDELKDFIASGGEDRQGSSPI
jgi:hypothetical protein